MIISKGITGSIQHFYFKQFKEIQHILYSILKDLLSSRLPPSRSMLTAVNTQPSFLAIINSSGHVKAHLAFGRKFLQAERTSELIFRMNSLLVLFQQRCNLTGFGRIHPHPPASSLPNFRTSDEAFYTIRNRWDLLDRWSRWATALVNDLCL